MSQQTQEETWDTNTTQQWFDAVNGWDWIYAAELNEYRKSGSCPRCGHTMERILGEWTILDNTSLVDIYCNCDKPHSGRPSDREGCGFGSNRFAPPR